MCWLLGLSITAGEGLGGKYQQSWCSVGPYGERSGWQMPDIHHPPNAWVLHVPGKPYGSHMHASSIFHNLFS